MGAKNGPVHERLWNHVDKSTPCWLWTGHRNIDGYGVIRDGRLIRLVHRISWEIVNGRINSDVLVCHHCDVRHCVRPSHLFVGTQADNMRDATVKGRRARGPANTNSKLTAKDIPVIRKAYEKGASLRELARAYGVTKNAIRNIFTGQSWRYVT